MTNLSFCNLDRNVGLDPRQSFANPIAGNAAANGIDLGSKCEYLVANVFRDQLLTGESGFGRHAICNCARETRKSVLRMPSASSFRMWLMR